MARTAALAQELAELETRCRAPVDSADCLAALTELLQLYDQLPDQSDVIAGRVRKAFLYGLGHVPSELIAHDDARRLASFLAEEIKATDLAGIHWQTASEVIT